MFALCWLNGALAAPPELSLDLELGQLHNGDESFDLFSERDGMPSRGVQAGVRVATPVVVQVSGHRVSRGLDLSVAEGLSIATAYFANEWTAGVRVDHTFADIFQPYAAVHGLLLQGAMKLDDEPEDDDNPNQLVARAVHPGALLTGGFEIRGPQQDRKWTAGFLVEAGYGLVARADYGDFGSMKPGGFVLRTGIGLRLF